MFVLYTVLGKRKVGSDPEPTLYELEMKRLRKERQQRVEDLIQEEAAKLKNPYICIHCTFVTECKDGEDIVEHCGMCETQNPAAVERSRNFGKDLLKKEEEERKKKRTRSQRQEQK